MAEDPVLALIRKARIDMVFEQGWYGQMAMLMNFREAKWVKRLATNGIDIFYNRQWVLEQTYPKLVFGIAHEILHCVRDHVARRGTRDPEVWNWALDFCVNYSLIKERIGEPPDDILYDPKYDHTWSPEAIYDDLMTRRSTLNLQTFDDHLDLESDANADGDGEFQVSVFGKNGKPVIRDKDIDAIRSQILANIMEAIAATEATGGTVPVGIKRDLNALVEPKIDWRAYLRGFVRSQLRGGFTWRRPSRRSFSTPGGIILPGRNKEKILEVAIGLDTSGSEDREMLTDFMSEIKGICTTVPRFILHVWSFDTQVYNYKVFTHRNSHEITKYEVYGDGGTLYEVNWEHMREHRLIPPRFVMLTDGMPGGSWGDPKYCDTLFVIHTHKVQAPFGATIHYEPRSRRRH